MSKGLEALENIKENIRYGCFLAKDWDRLDIVEKELKALEIIFKYIRIGNPFGNVHYIYLNDGSEMIMPKDFEILKEVLLWD